MLPTLVDTHAHPADDSLRGDSDLILENARRQGVRAVLSVGYDRETSRLAMEMAGLYPGWRPTVGIHPTSIGDASDADFAAIEEWAGSDAVAAIGETGLDFYWDTTPHERQRELFHRHLGLAVRRGLPVTIHSRNAEVAVLAELRTHPPPGAALHCFGGEMAAARTALDMGLYLGVGGPITFKKSTELQEIVRWMPLDRLLLETDSPYLSPHPFRGKRNEPARVSVVAHRIAEIRGMTYEEVCGRTTENALRLYPRLREALERPVPSDVTEEREDCERERTHV